MRCDARGRRGCRRGLRMGVKVPVVVRLEGTNVEEGRKIFVNSGLNFTVADGMLDADQSRGLSKGGM